MQWPAGARSSDCRGQSEPESGAPAVDILAADRTLVRFDDSAAGGQPQARTVVLGGEKRTKQLRTRLGRQTHAVVESRVDAAVAFHGGRTEEFLSEAADIDGPLQMHLAEEDEFIPKEAQRAITAALAGNPKVELFSYPGCRHAFSRHGGAHFNLDAARLSRTRTLDFFRRELA